MFGLPESGLAETLRDAEQTVPGFDRLEITTCLRRGELEIVTRYEPDAAPVYQQLVGVLRDRHGREAGGLAIRLLVGLVEPACIVKQAHGENVVHYARLHIAHSYMVVPLTGA